MAWFTFLLNHDYTYTWFPALFLKVLTEKEQCNTYLGVKWLSQELSAPS